MKSIVIALVMVATSSFAYAENITEKAMQDHPGHVGAGSTADPTAKPNSGSLSEKSMQIQPGVNTDRTSTTSEPTAQPDSSSLSGKAMRDITAR